MSHLDFSALYWAANRGLYSSVQALLAHPNIQVNAASLVQGFTARPLQPSSVTRLRSVPSFSDSRVDVNAADKTGATPLHAAARNGHVSALKVLRLILVITFAAVNFFGLSAIVGCPEVSFRVFKSDPRFVDAEYETATSGVTRAFFSWCAYFCGDDCTISGTCSFDYGNAEPACNDGRLPVLIGWTHIDWRRHIWLGKFEDAYR